MAALHRGRSEVVLDLQRLYMIFWAFLILLLSFVLRLWYLQILKGKEFSIASEQQSVREVTKPAPRGNIYDRNGQLLLSNHPFFDLVIIPQYLQNKEKTLQIVSKLFQVPLESIEKRLQESSDLPRFVPIRIKRNLTLHEVAIIESNKFFLPGVDVSTVPRRDYSQNESAHLLGYLGEVTSRELDSYIAENPGTSLKVGDTLGKMGVEKKYERYLRGADGKEYLQVDAYGRVRTKQGFEFELYHSMPEKRGSDIFITVDEDVQRAAIDAFRNKNGAVVAVNAQSGEILAYVSNPNFSLKLYQDGLSNEDWQSFQANPFKPLLDKVTGGAYPPGSTFKIITAIAALEENIIHPQRTFNCNGLFSLGRGKWRCWKKGGHGVVNMRRAIEGSCDVYFYQVGNMLGVDRIAKWARAFGLGERTELGLNMEVPGLVPSTEWKIRSRGRPWAPGDTINFSIGQGDNLATPLQVAMMYAALGNGGKLLRPYLLKKVTDETGKEIEGEKTSIRNVIKLKPLTSEVVRGGVFDVVMSPTGTGKKARVEGFSVSGKTGTAQTSALRRRKEEDQEVSFQKLDHAWFAAYSPSENPEIAVVALSENDSEGGGGSQAAPIVQKVIEAYWKKKYPEKFAKKKE